MQLEKKTHVNQMYTKQAMMIDVFRYVASACVPGRVTSRLNAIIGLVRSMHDGCNTTNLE